MITLTAQEMNAQTIVQKQAMYDALKLDTETKIQDAIAAAVDKGEFSATISLKFDYNIEGMNEFLVLEILSKIAGELEVNKFRMEHTHKYSHEFFVMVSWAYRHIYKINPPM